MLGDLHTSMQAACKTHQHTRGLEMTLVDVLGDLGLHDVQVAGKSQVVLAQARVVHELVNFVVIRLNKDVLAGENERQLLLERTGGLGKHCFL